MTVEFDDKWLKDKGITDPVAYLKDLVEFEEYVQSQYVQINDEAWSHVEGEEDE